MNGTSRSSFRLLACVLAAVAMLALAACGGSDSDEGSTTASDGDARALTTVTVGVQPTAPFVSVPLGVQEGFFRRHGLDVKTRVISTATTIPPALLAGQLQFSDWSFPSFTSLADRRLPLKIVGPGDTAGTDLDTDYLQLLVMRDSGITSVEQLEGKTIAVNALAGLTEVQVKAALEDAGVDPESAKLVPIPFPDQYSALASGRVDAIGAGEPFLTLAKQRGDVRSLVALDVAVMPDLPVSLWMTSAEYAEENPDVVRAFQLGLKESLEFARANPDAVRQLMPSFAGVEAAVADEMILPNWTTEIDEAKVQEIAEIMHQYGVTESVPQMSDYILEFPLPEGQE